MRQYALPLCLCVAVLALFLLPLARGAGSAYKDVLLKDVPHITQKPDFCGEACIEMWTTSLKHPITQDQVFNESGVNPVEGRGCITRDMAAVLSKLGFTPGDVWYNYETKDAKTALDEQFAALHADLVKGVPSIVCMHYDDKTKSTEHFRLILGFDAKTDEVIYHEPAEDGDAASYKRMARALFLKLWPLTQDETHQIAIRMRLEIPAGGKLKDITKTEAGAGGGFTDADYCQHVMTVREKMPKGFTYRIQRPFIVISDEDSATMHNHAEKTVKWAVDKLKAEYFAKEPADILDIWLFKDKDSYDTYTKKIFNDTPTTPYGYYSPTAKSLIMNIATGGGTLVHEIVHPFMATNFPACPPWFNEGMGSLYEQSGEEDGHIHGYPNWRLPALQKAIKAGSVPSFEKLCALSVNAFYNEDRGTNYAQSRYLLYYLQDQGLLQKYYKEFTANAKEDPTGFNSLKKILGENDMDKFKTKWEKFVLAMPAP